MGFTISNRDMHIVITNGKFITGQQYLLGALRLAPAKASRKIPVIRSCFQNIIIAFVLCFFFISPTNALAGQAHLAWDPPDISTDVTGYMILTDGFGTYTQAIDVRQYNSYALATF